MITAGAAPASRRCAPVRIHRTTSIKLTANIKLHRGHDRQRHHIGASDITVNLNGHSILGRAPTT